MAVKQIMSDERLAELREAYSRTSTVNGGETTCPCGCAFIGSEKYLCCEAHEPVKKRVVCVCGGEFVAQVPGENSTLIYYGAPDGHDHDDNCKTRVYLCAAGHATKLSARTRCSASGCDWRGKESCFCHPGQKLDVWPDAPIQQMTMREALALHSKATWPNEPVKKVPWNGLGRVCDHLGCDWGSGVCKQR